MLRRCRWFWLALVVTIALSAIPVVSRASDVETLLQQSRQRYDAGQLTEAKALLTKVQQQAEAAGDRLTRAIALSNLALIESQQGNWSAANQAIAASLEVRSLVAPQQPIVLAQVLNVQGRLQLAQGNSQAALQTWQQSAALYRQAGNATGELQSQLRQTEALQAIGSYNRAYQELRSLRNRLQSQPDSATKVWGLRSLGDAIARVGDLRSAETLVQESLTLAQRLQQPDAIATSQLSLANLIATRIRELDTDSLTPAEEAQRQRDIAEAIALYQQVAARSSPNRLRAHLNQLALLIDLNRQSEATELAATMQPDILTLAPDRFGVEARLNFANSLLRLQKPNPTIAPLFTTAVEQAKALNDPHLLANAYGNLGRAQSQLAAAQASTEQALLLATAAHAPEQVYRWSAQLGRLQEQQGDREAAIQSYTQAVNSLRSLRQDLLGLADTQLVDPDALEPVHRRLVNLLLPQAGQPDRATLKRVREVIESLQLEEINNYLRAACIQAQVAIDQVPVPQQTAVVYPIVLPSDRLAIIVSITGQEPKLYSQTVSQTQLEATVKALQAGLRNRISLEFQQPSQQLYRWLIQPIVADLQQQNVETLVFVLDEALRSVPMAALSNGDQFLIEQYSLATTPGLKLSSPQPLQAKALSSIAFGLTEARTVSLPTGGSKTFSDLPFVQPELTDLQQEIQPSTIQLNQTFTRDRFRTTLQTSQAPIVHLATHGQFSSNRDQTFLLASDGVINIDELAVALGANDSRTTPIELLVLSACETATGDNRAPLGLAGIALKSGARSTIASLWKVNDAATSQLMQRFYKEVATRQVTKAVALQRAQREILADPLFRRHPYFWAPFILVGNWL